MFSINILTEQLCTQFFLENEQDIFAEQGQEMFLNLEKKVKMERGRNYRKEIYTLSSLWGRGTEIRKWVVA